jgi:hypothetical protein
MPVSLAPRWEPPGVRGGALLTYAIAMMRGDNGRMQRHDTPRHRLVGCVPLHGGLGAAHAGVARAFDRTTHGTSRFMPTVFTFLFSKGERGAIPWIKTYDSLDGESDACIMNGSKNKENKRAPQLPPPPISGVDVSPCHNFASRDITAAPFKNLPSRSFDEAPLEAKLVAHPSSPAASLCCYKGYA